MLLFDNAKACTSIPLLIGNNHLKELLGKSRAKKIVKKK